MQELRVALGWKERFAMESPFMVLDMGLHTPKSAVPRAFRFRRYGARNLEAPLPCRPVQYHHTTNIFHAYTRDLHLRSLHFDMGDDKADVRTASFFTSPGAVEAMLNVSMPYLVSLRVAGEWTWDMRTGTGSRLETRVVPRSAVSKASGSIEGTQDRRRRFFHVRLTSTPHVISNLETQICVTTQVCGPSGSLAWGYLA